MIELKLNESKIKRITYALNGKDVTFIFKNGELYDIGFCYDESLSDKQKKSKSTYVCFDNDLKLTKGESDTLEASREKEWIDSVKEKKIKVSDFKQVNLDEKYKDFTHDEKMQVSKQIIEKDANEDTEFIKKKVESSIGDNNPLSEEVSKYQKRNIE